MDSVPFLKFLTAIEGQLTEGLSYPNAVKRICLDSRTIKPNNVFWAIPGENHDGHKFVQEAIQNGAAACIVNHAHQPTKAQCQLPIIHVKDTMKSLQRFAKWYRDQFNIPCIGITGSYGKTTTRELLHSVLSTKQTGICNQHNDNNEIGVPLTLFNLDQQHQYLIVEMGAAKPGDIQPLAEISSPRIGLITGIGPAHLEGFGSVEQIVKTKGDLLAALPNDGLAIIPGGTEWTSQLTERASCRVTTFGLQPGNTYQAKQVKCGNTQLRFQVNGADYQLPVSGSHYLSAALGVVAVGMELGFASSEIQDGFSRFRPVPGRSQVVQTFPWTIIDDTYNANPVSCEAACHMLANWTTSGRRFFVLGDMLELGEDSQEYHEQIGKVSAKLGIDFVYACGEYADDVAGGVVGFQGSCSKVIARTSQQELSHLLPQEIQPGDVILVKGSRGMKMESTVKVLATQIVQQQLSAVN